MTVYAESSAVLAWLFEEPPADEVRKHLASADAVFSSDLTLVECRRAVRRAVLLNDVSEADASELLGLLSAVSREWHLLELDVDVLERAGGAFPAEPIRTLDALHVASALKALTGVSGMAMLALDERVRRNAQQLGFEVLP